MRTPPEAKSSHRSGEICTQLNKRIKAFLGVDCSDLYNTDRFIDIKLSCREQMLQKLMDYDPAKGAEYATYIFPFIRDAMLCFRMGEEKWSVSSLTNYKMVRSMAWLYHNTKDAVSEFAKKYNCDLALARSENKTGQGHKAFEVQICTEEKMAAKRRDFTINALMINIFTNDFLDFYGGVKDLENKILRHIDAQSFQEDSLRVLRALHFVARFKFHIAPQSLKLMQSMDISDLSKERINAELYKFFQAQDIFSSRA